MDKHILRSETSQPNQDMSTVLLMLTQQNELRERELELREAQEKRAYWQHKETIYAHRQSLPPGEQSRWVSIDEAAFLLGIELGSTSTTVYHRRVIRYFHKIGELITIRGKNCPSFLRTEVMETLKRLDEEIIEIPRKV